MAGMMFDILHVWVEDGYRMKHESIGPFPGADEAATFAEKHIDQRSLEYHGRLYDIFIVGNDGSVCTSTPEAYLMELEEMYGADDE